MNASYPEANALYPEALVRSARVRSTTITAFHHRMVHGYLLWTPVGPLLAPR